MVRAETTPQRMLLLDTLTVSAVFNKGRDGKDGEGRFWEWFVGVLRRDVIGYGRVR